MRGLVIMWNHYITCFYISIVIKYVSGCQCNLNHTDLNKEKRQLDSEEYTATELIDSTPATETKETIVEMSTNTYLYETTFMDIHETTTESFESIVRIFDIEANRSHVLPEENNTLDNIFDVNENSSEVMDMVNTNVNLNKYDAEFLIDNETTTEKPKERTTVKVDDSERDRKKHNDLKRKCPYYKNGNSFKLDKLPGVWQVIYYRLPNKMKCFKINIKMLNKTVQERYARVYGSFNDTVHWNNTFLEITSIDTETNGRRHFLQGAETEKGVMRNVIIDEEYSGNATFLSLHNEGGDQWLVIRNLLLMRDCEDGDFVVFTRYPKQPRKADVMEALKKFGESQSKGTIACNIEKFWQKFEEEKHGNHVVRTRENKKYISKHYNKNITAGVNYH